mmetsp:Transcript_10284/g.41616  ORF Transcript_10284/g.41616 Transcript_10284/m.41616 type:complete len:499 (-) Transcript_10284:2247-3743(-)
MLGPAAHIVAFAAVQRWTTEALVSLGGGLPASRRAVRRPVVTTVGDDTAGDAGSQPKTRRRRSVEAPTTTSSAGDVIALDTALLETLTADPRGEFADLKSLFADDREGGSLVDLLVRSSQDDDDAAFDFVTAPGVSTEEVPSSSSAALTTTVSSPVHSDDEEQPSLLGWRLAILGITVCWSTNFALVKYAVEAMPVHAATTGPLFVAARFAVAAIAVAPWLFEASSLEVLWKGARVGAWCALGYAAQALALDTFDAAASVTAFECSLQTLVVAGWTAHASRSAVPGKTRVAIALAVAGVAALCLAGASESSASPGAISHHSSLVGSLVALGQAVGFGASYVELEEASEQFGPDQAKPLAAVQCLVVAVAAIGLAGLSTVSDAGGDIVASVSAFAGDLVTSPEALASLAWMALVSTAFTIWLQTIAFAKVSATDASIILVTEPLWAALCAHALLGEVFGPAQLAGGSAVLAAIAVNDGLVDLPPMFGGGGDDDQNDAPL